MSFVVRLLEQKIRSRVIRVVVLRVECEMGPMQRCEEGEEERWGQLYLTSSANSDLCFVRLTFSSLNRPIVRAVH